MFDLNYCTKIRRYLEPFRGTGKTLAIEERAKQILAKGEKVALIVKDPFRWRAGLQKFDATGENILVEKFDNVLKDIDRVPIIERDPILCSIKDLPQFNGYRVLIDPECYEVLIYEVLSKLELVNNKLWEIQKCLSK